MRSCTLRQPVTASGSSCSAGSGGHSQHVHTSLEDLECLPFTLTTTQTTSPTNKQNTRQGPRVQQDAVQEALRQRVGDASVWSLVFVFTCVCVCSCWCVCKCLHVQLEVSVVESSFKVSRSLCFVASAKTFMLFFMETDAPMRFSRPSLFPSVITHSQPLPLKASSCCALLRGLRNSRN